MTPLSKNGDWGRKKGGKSRGKYGPGRLKANKFLAVQQTLLHTASYYTNLVVWFKDHCPNSTLMPEIKSVYSCYKQPHSKGEVNKPLVEERYRLNIGIAASILRQSLLIDFHSVGRNSSVTNEKRVRERSSNPAYILT